MRVEVAYKEQSRQWSIEPKFEETMGSRKGIAEVFRAGKYILRILRVM